MTSRQRETVMQYVAKTDKFLLSTGTSSFDEQGRVALIVINERDMTISPLAIRFLMGYSFPGNIRELKSIIENAVVMSETNQIDKFIQTSIAEEKSALNLPDQQSVDDNDLNLKGRLDKMEKHLLLQAKQKCRTTREMAVILVSARLLLLENCKNTTSIKGDTKIDLRSFNESKLCSNLIQTKQTNRFDLFLYRKRPQHTYIT